jgi:hypothetical protein
MTIPIRNGFKSVPVNGTTTPEVGEMICADCEFLIWEFLKNAEVAGDNFMFILGMTNHTDC